MPKRPRLIGHDERLSIVDHLDELRSRLIVCAWSSSTRPVPASRRKIGAIATHGTS
jgi:hypothetical protein